ncbi:uncharacterized lipoprotein YehR (DUF1307 family) [Breznakia sp. PF5-3]|uniref:hypothetical protein n=1 Tax=unclassified Breznakia TaxID=2623764 RepID=UPI002405D755|nr:MULTISPECIES: hypothetical protein [unclassified Breznakia]MDF9825283.1 uncharacterized lipoprotein YehR (DUF1307 family) [Breznakia sp. PM6-1]MDF9836171.1 uncharacterized lipoprotein YehR (DUF1307 family) [Breznakia sp. PF5-3]MDF9837383.1 uncharacterized lipoprotein YehR (DUF1307 family) [Breznakia sp. PFB2-8]MDF9859318.1 uncharacterized lipoprotein YehR (DUF1307 family) [Breznakia sp. PH5-24]
MKKISIVIAMMLCILIGCESNEEKKTVCENLQIEDSAIREQHQIYYIQDEVSKIEMTNTFDLTKTSIQENSLDSYKESMEARYKGAKGITYSFESNDNDFKEILVFEISDDNLKGTLMQNLLLTYYGVEDNNLDAKTIIKHLKDKGMKCK